MLIITLFSLLLRTLLANNISSISPVLCLSCEVYPFMWYRRSKDFQDIHVHLCWTYFSLFCRRGSILEIMCCLCLRLEFRCWSNGFSSFLSLKKWAGVLLSLFCPCFSNKITLRCSNDVLMSFHFPDSYSLSWWWSLEEVSQPISWLSHC